MAVVTDFTVIAGKAVDFSITIKENGSIAPLVLDVSDTFVFSIINKKTSQKYIDSKAMTITDLLNGEVSGSISALESATLPIKKSSAEDGYISRPNLRLVVHGTTLSQGQMTAVIENVYVTVG